MGQKGKSIELIVAVWCCLHGNCLQRVLRHRIDSLGALKLRGLSLLMPTCGILVYVLAVMALGFGLLAHGRWNRRSILIVFELRISGILLIFKTLDGAYNAAVTMLAELCLPTYGAENRTNRDSPALVVAAAIQNSTRVLRTQFEHGTAIRQIFSSWMIYTMIAIQYGLALPVALHLQPTTFWTGT